MRREPELEPKTQTLKQATVAGLGWNFANQFFVQIVSLAIGVVLSRLLGPSEFGLIMMVTVITQFAYVFADLGFASALIQKEVVDEYDKSTVFWTNLTMGLFIALLIAISSPLIAGFYQQPILSSICLFVALNFVLSSLNIVQRSLFERELAFKKLFWVNMVANLGSGAIAIWMAFSGWGVWSLVAKLLGQTVLTTIILWGISNWRPQWKFSWDSFRSVSNFGLPLLGTGSLNYWTRNIDNLLIGRFWGDEALGFYEKSYRLMLLPVSNLTRVISKVMFPSLSKIQDDPVKVKRIFLRLIGAVSLFAFPVSIGLSILAEPLILGIYGPKWQGSVPMLQVLSLLGLNQSLSGLNGIVYQSQNATMLQFRWGLVMKTIVVAAILVGLPFGAVGVAISYTVGSFLVTIPNWLVIGKVIPVKVSEILLQCGWAFVGSLLMGLAVFASKVIAESYGVPHWGQLLVGTSLGMAVYLLSVHLVKAPSYLEVSSLVVGRFKKAY